MKKIISIVVFAVLFNVATAQIKSPEVNIYGLDTLKSVNYLGENSSMLFSIGNEGDADLDYSMEIVYNNGKSSGGADSLTYGYYWKDSDEPDGPVYEWRELTGTGSSLNVGDESVSSQIDIGFDFNFFENTYSTVAVCSNGYLIFGTSYNDYYNFPIPEPGFLPNNFIAGFWNDLDQSSGGNVLYYHDESENIFIVQFDQVPQYGSEESNTFQIILYENGAIKLQYKEMNGYLEECTVGIENSDGELGVQVAYNESYLKNGLAVLIVPTIPWLTVMPSAGSVSPSAADQITADFDSAELFKGVYYATINLSTNDPATPVVSIPVEYIVYTLETPLNLVTNAVGTVFSVNWDDVPFATAYKVYSSNDPYGTFTEDTSGSFAGSSWSTSIVNAKKFYKVTALDAK